MNCPICEEISRVIDSERKEENVYRSRRCKDGHQFATVEIEVESLPLSLYKQLKDVKLKRFKIG